MLADLTTARLRWRQPRPDDVDGYMAFVSDFEVVKNLGTWPYPADRAFTAGRCVPVDPGLGMAGPVFLEGEMIGGMGLIQGDFGYMFARPHWGKGYATEIGRALIAQAFATYDWPEITACVFIDNPASARVLDKLGFAETGACDGPCAARGQDLPMRSFRLPRPRTA